MPPADSLQGLGLLLRLLHGSAEAGAPLDTDVRVHQVVIGPDTLSCRHAPERRGGDVAHLPPHRVVVADAGLSLGTHPPTDTRRLLLGVRVHARPQAAAAASTVLRTTASSTGTL